MCPNPRSDQILRHRLLMLWLLVLALVTAGLLVVVAPEPGAVLAAARAEAPVESPAVRRSTAPKRACRRLDPNLVRGVCLRLPGRRGFSWIGSLRAPDGRTFFCIDYLYDSRLPGRARVVGTGRLISQTGRRIRRQEIAALTYVVSRWAPHGSTGSDARDAAIALLMREAMGDGVRPDHLVVYPGPLHVGDVVRRPVADPGHAVMRLARRMWHDASRWYGPYRVLLTGSHRAIPLGRSRTLHLVVRSASGHKVPRVPARIRCDGPVVCRLGRHSTPRATTVEVRPTGRGRVRLQVSIDGPAGHGRLLQAGGWRAHAGRTARPHGHQRGWIAVRSRSRAHVDLATRVIKARPQVHTQASPHTAYPGAALTDRVRVSGLPQGYRASVTAALYGPFASRPGPADCTTGREVGRVDLPIRGNGTFVTPPVTVHDVGLYTWVERFAGDARTHAVITACGDVAETSRVTPLPVQVRTVVSRQRALVGDVVHDDVTLSMPATSAATPLRLHWRLLGPVKARHRSCSGLAWGRAPVRAQGVIAVAGAGGFRTPDVVVSRAGCYSYAESVPATPLTLAADSPAGLRDETTLVRRRRPTLHTRASAARLRVGDRLHDVVRLGGVAPGEVAPVHWRLLGPVAPGRGGSCTAAAWAKAPVHSRGTLRFVGPGTLPTAAVRVTRPGCYTFTAHLFGTPAFTGARSAAGLPSETGLALRPPTPGHPEVPSGAARTPHPVRPPATPPAARYLYRTYVAPARLRPTGDLGELRIARLGIRAPIAAVGLDHGVLAVPNDRHVVGWLRRSAPVGDLVGTTVLAGHVSDRSDRAGALAPLRRARVGDVVKWRVGKQATTFVVTSVRRYPRAHGLPHAVFDAGTSRVLRLITCTARRRLPGGGFHYADNLVVTAVPR